MVETNTATVQNTEPSQQQNQQTQPGSDNPDTLPLVQRVAKFMESNNPEKAAVKVADDFKFDFNEINKIQDPQAKEFAEKAYKSFQRGFNQKFQELAELRKGIETTAQDSAWTPARIQQLLNNPEFVQAAQTVAAPQGTGLTNDEWSALNDTEKAQLVAMQKEISSLKQMNMNAFKAQQDAVLKQSYANYDAQKVDTLLADMMNQKVNATREHLWKVIDYEPAVKRAYELGRQDERNGTSDKVASMSTDGFSAQPSQTLKPEANESGMSFWRRIAQQRLKESKSGQQTRI